MKYVTVKNLYNLKPGDNVRSKSSEITYVVVANYGTRVTAVRTADITNAIEWEVLINENEP